MKLIRRCSVLLAFLCFSLVARGQITLSRISTVSGAPGAAVTLSGVGFPPEATVSINDVAAAVTGVTANQISFTVPAAASSGAIKVHVDDAEFTYPFSFTVLRPVTGQLSLPAGVTASNYVTLVWAHQPVVDAGGNFSSFAPKDESSYAWVYGPPQISPFLAPVLPGTNHIVINARSTAEALFLMTPILGTSSPERAKNLLGLMTNIPEVQTAADLIASISGAGRHYMDDSRFSTALENGLVALIQAEQAATPSPGGRNFEPDTPPGTRLAYVTPPAGIADLRRLLGTIAAADASHPDHHRIKVESAGNFAPIENPVDWFVNLYELDPKQFTNGLPEVRDLAYDAVPRKLRADADATASVAASLFTKKLDVVDWASGIITDAIFGNTVEEWDGFVGPSELPVSQHSAGVYVAEAYSGNIFHGTGLFSSSPANQSGLIDNIGGRGPWVATAAANIFVAAMDAIPNMKELKKGLSGQEGPDPKFFVDVGNNVMQDVLKSAAIHGSDMNKEAAYDIVKTAASSLLKSLTNKLLESGNEFKDADHWGQTALRSVIKLIDISSKVSGVLQAVERTTGLVGNSVLAVERTIIVVGEPFAPSLESFYPQQGQGGEIMTIQGYNFPGTTNFLRVSFCQFASTSDPNLATARIDLQILAANTNTIAVRVPTNGPAIFSNRRAFVCVEVTNRNFMATSIPLAAPFHEFEFIGAPELTSVYQTPAHPGGLLELRGRFFDASAPQQHEFYIDGSWQGNAYTARSNSLVVRLPNFLPTGTHTISVRLRDLQTPAINFEVVPYPYLTAGTATKGLRIMVTKADFSNAADGKISVLEAAMIANGTLGRPIEDHLPCESIPAGEPGACPRVRREVDDIQYLNNSPGGGVNSSDHIYLSPDITNSTVVTGSLPPLTSGDSYSLPLIINNSGGNDGLVLDGVSNVSVSGLTLRNFPGNGIVLRNGAANNRLQFIKVENCGGSGALLEGNAQFNDILSLSVSNATLHGLHLTGADVRLNNIQASGGSSSNPFTSYQKCGGNGIRIENSASFNHIFPGTIRDSLGAGVLITGAGTSHNFVGRVSDELARHNDIINSGSHGIHLTAGVQGNILRYLNPGGSQGDGFLLEGADCAYNQIDRCSPGLNLYEGGTDTALPNAGSGIHLRDGAHHNLIGRHDPIAFGEQGCIGGNRDDGILLDGADTAYNTINAQWISLRSLQFNPFQVRFQPNGLSGIRIRNGSHNNRIGDIQKDLQNFIFGSPEAGITIEGSTTRSNKVFGNQIGTYHGEFSHSGIGRNQIGILIRDSANANTIGVPGSRLAVPVSSFTSMYFQYGNVITRTVNDGIRIENCSGQVGTDGVLRFANLIQNNKIGLEDTGNLGPNGTGITLAEGAYGTLIGGPTLAHGNTIKGNLLTGIRIENNHVPGTRMRNRILNNVIESTSAGAGVLRFPYLTEMPTSGIGLLLLNSSGHVIGEEIKNANRINLNRLGVYMWNSSNNVVQGNILSNQFNATIAIYGGSGNVIGGNHPSLGNHVIAYGLREPGQGGVALSHTTSNRVQANIIGHLAPGRGGVGVLLTNATFNEIGGAARVSGNTIVSNFSHGVLITGANSTGNRFIQNFIGVSSRGVLQANSGDGVRIEGGAHGNEIGGEVAFTRAGFASSIAFGNSIVGNVGAGVHVDGASTIGNSILHNQITGNHGRGIQHSNGGNNLIPPPTMVAFDGAYVSGTVQDLGVTPPGSIIQIFSDPNNVDPEGDAFLGQTTVRADGTWRAVLTGSLHHSNVTMTATHALLASTSEFGTGNVVPIGFHLSRTDSTTQESAAAGAQNVPVFRLSLQAINASVRLKSISFDAQGTLPDTSAVSGAKLFHDADEDGQVGLGDFYLAGPATFGAEDGRITLVTTNTVIPANTTQKWLLTFNLHAGSPAGSKFSLVVTNTEVVDSEFVHPIGQRAVPIGTFALHSAEFTVAGGPVGQSFAQWKSSVFNASQLTNAAISGNLADPDGDKLPNLLEYAYDLNPLLADRDQEPGMPHAKRLQLFDPVSGSNQDFLVVTFVRRKPPVDLEYLVELSDDVSAWTPLEPELTLHEQEDIGDGMVVEKVVYRGTRPMTGPNRIAKQFVRVRVELVP